MPVDLERATSKEERQYVLNAFFDTVSAFKAKVDSQYGQPVQQNSSSPGKRLINRKSPVKSPVKRSDKENGDTSSPQKFAGKSPGKKPLSPVKKPMSPTKAPNVKLQNVESSKEDRKSQRRRRTEIDFTIEEEQPAKTSLPKPSEEKSDVNHLQVPQLPSENDHLKSCKKSPVKRMKKLEAQDSVENQENIETTYMKNQESQLEEELEDDEALEPRFLQPEKCLLTQQEMLIDETSATEVQLAKRPVDICDIIDVDSNVINYGQFICGKILGSTLLLSNLSE